MGQGICQPLRYQIFAQSDERYGASGRAKRAQWQFRTSDNRIGCGLDQICRQFGEFLVADAEATRKDFKVLVFDEAMEPQLIEKRSDGGPVPGGGDEKTDTIDATRLLSACRKRKATAALPSPATNVRRPIVTVIRPLWEGLLKII